MNQTTQVDKNNEFQDTSIRRLCDLTKFSVPSGYTSTHGQILYGPYANISNESNEWKLIKHEDLTLDIVSQGFYEGIGGNIEFGHGTYTQEYVRMFFDVDSVKDLSEFYEIIAFLEKLKPLLGDYSISGYTGDKEVSEKTQCKYYENAGKFMSLHIVFYESALFIDDIVDLFNCKKFIRTHQEIYSIISLLKLKFFNQK